MCFSLNIEKSLLNLYKYIVNLISAAICHWRPPEKLPHCVHIFSIENCYTKVMNVKLSVIQKQTKQKRPWKPAFLISVWWVMESFTWLGYFISEISSLVWGSWDLVISRNPKHQSEFSINLNQTLMTAGGLFADVVSQLSVKSDQHVPTQFRWTRLSRV